MSAPSKVIDNDNYTIHQYRVSDDIRVSFVSRVVNESDEVFWVRQSYNGESRLVGFNKEATDGIIAALRAEGLI